MNIIHYMAPTTMAKFEVYGRMAGNRYEPYEAREFRQARPNEVVECSGRYWRLVFNGRRFAGNEDVTADVAEYYNAALVLEAMISAVHGDMHARMLTGTSEPLQREDALNRFVSGGN